MAEPLVDVRALGKRYGLRVAVTGVTLRLMPGEIVGLVGANGGGKTTTLRMLAGLTRPDAGTGTVLGGDVAYADKRRAQIGYMPQNLSLYPDLTVAENLRFRADMFSLPQPKAVVAEAVERWRLTPMLQQRFADLSGGWGRRVQCAATMLHAPGLLLLDEPTAGLDVLTRNDIWTWLSLLAARGHGVVVATHDLAEAERCPSILFYQDGVADGPMLPAALVARSGTATLEAAVAALSVGGQ